MPETPRETDRAIGALWIKRSKAGSVFLSGSIDNVEVVVFKNERKVEGSNQPDWRVLKSRPRPTAPAPTDDPFADGPPPEDVAF
jgi:uncharacterized protein (DUF736 family)|tara:strand:- start:368 stop:619 length:252 start_codon:yes stop_codon:yes gene_type:complete